MKEAAKNELVERYFRYVSLLTALRQSYGLQSLSPHQEALLVFIAQSWQDDKPLSVRKLMAVCTLASTVTIYRWLKALMAQGFVEPALDPSDSRRRLLKPTRLAIEFFKAKAKAITKALR